MLTRRYRLLGGLEVTDGARHLDLGPRKQRALLAALLLADLVERGRAEQAAGDLRAAADTLRTALTMYAPLLPEFEDEEFRRVPAERLEAVRFAGTAALPGADVLLLTVVRRRSGRRYAVPLRYLRDGDDYIVAAANRGADTTPQWWHNLHETPYAEVEIGGQRIPAVAHDVDRDERLGWWQSFVAVDPTLADRQAALARTIPLIRLRRYRPPTAPAVLARGSGRVAVPGAPAVVARGPEG